MWILQGPSLPLLEPETALQRGAIWQAFPRPCASRWGTGKIPAGGTPQMIGTRSCTWPGFHMGRGCPLNSATPPQSQPNTKMATRKAVKPSTPAPVSPGSDG